MGPSHNYLLSLLISAKCYIKNVNCLNSFLTYQVFSAVDLVFITLSIDYIPTVEGIFNLIMNSRTLNGLNCADVLLNNIHPSIRYETYQIHQNSTAAIATNTEK